MNLKMQGLCDFHTHTKWSDGKNTPEEMVLEAISRGASALGFSDHSYTFFDRSYCMKAEDYEAYKNEIKVLKEKYKDKINIFCGIEQDYRSEVKPEGFDYVIGSVHYIKCEEEYFPVDDGADILIKAADKYFGGDIYSLIEEYYRLVGDVVDKTNCDLIGHFDLIRKYNQRTPFFNESDERVITAQNDALDRLIATGIPFEINTGSQSRGYRNDHYTTGWMMDKIKAAGVDMIPSSDSHNKDNLFFGFEKYI